MAQKVSPIANEVNPLIFPLHMFCMRYKLCFSNRKKLQFFFFLTGNFTHHLNPQNKAQLGWPKMLAQLDNQLCIKRETHRIF